MSRGGKLAPEVNRYLLRRPPPRAPHANHQANHATQRAFRQEPQLQRQPRRPL